MKVTEEMQIKKDTHTPKTPQTHTVCVCVARIQYKIKDKGLFNWWYAYH